MIKIEDAKNKLHNNIIQQIENLDNLLGSVNQNKVGQNDHCLAADRGIRAVCEVNEEVCNRKGQVEQRARRQIIRSISRSTCSSDKGWFQRCQASGNLHLQEGSSSLMGGRLIHSFLSALCSFLGGLHPSTQENLPETSEQWK